MSWACRSACHVFLHVDIPRSEQSLPPPAAKLVLRASPATKLQLGVYSITGSWKNNCHPQPCFRGRHNAMLRCSSPIKYLGARRAPRLGRPSARFTRRSRDAQPGCGGGASSFALRVLFHVLQKFILIPSYKWKCGKRLLFSFRQGFLPLLKLSRLKCQSVSFLL